MTFAPVKHTAFKAAFNALCDAERERFRALVCWGCQIDKSTFYRWLENPDLISKSDRYHIAMLMNEADPRELFKTLDA